MDIQVPDDIVAFFNVYRNAFNSLQGAAIAQLYAEPSGIAQDGSYVHWPTHEPAIENMNALCRLYEDKGFVRADFKVCSLIDQGEKHAIADLQWRIIWNANQIPWNFQTSYNLVRTTTGWRILLCTAYSEPSLGNAEPQSG
jgi:hypothetical protein